MKTKYTSYVFFVVVSIMIASCGRDKSDNPFEGFEVYDNFGPNMIQYHRASQDFSIEEKGGNPKVYIDFSDGMVQAYTSNPANREIIQAITNKLVSTDVEWYSLGNSKIEKLEYSSNELYNKVTNPAAYKNIMAPIQEALKQITSSKNDAVLITDFEEYTSDGKEQFENYPKKYFIDWLKAGNTITFFYTDYTEKNATSNLTVTKHLYFTVFNYGPVTDKSVVTKIRESLVGRDMTKVYELGGQPVILENKYGGKEGTGISNKNFQKWVKYNFNGLAENGGRFEIIGLNKNWNDNVEEYVKTIIEKENRVFFSNLFLNAENKSYYDLKDIKVNVYDVTENYGQFVKWLKIKETKPTFTQDEGKNKVWDQASKGNPIITACYEKNTDKIKESWIYKPSINEEAKWEEVFELNMDIFKDHLKNDPANIELRTIFHKNYKKKNVKNEAALLRIDLVYNEIEFNANSEQLKDFQWQSATLKDKVNNSLLEAIRNTLQEVSINPKGKAMYTYYLKFGLKNSNK